jgi:Spy/CpxP family protein refolding chaperone
MKTLVRLMSVSSLVMAGLVVPSIASADQNQQQQQEEAVGTAAQAVHGDKHKIFDNAIDAAKLRPDQQDKVDRLRSEWRDRHAPVDKAKHELILAVADQIEKGDIDRCALGPHVDTLASAKAKTKQGDRASLEKLHSILDPDQRARFADSMKNQFERMKQAHSADALVDKLDHELGLNEDQKKELREIIGGLKQVRDARPEHQEHRARMRRVFDAFKGDHFVLDEIAPLPDDLEQRIAKQIDDRLWAAEAILPVLDQNQCAKLADKLRDGARRHGEPEGGANRPGHEHHQEVEDDD